MSQNNRTAEANAGNRGLALLTVTALLLVLTVLAIGLTRETRLIIRVAGGAVASAQAEAAAEGGEIWAALLLAADRRGTVRPEIDVGGTGIEASASGRDTFWAGRIGGADVRVRVEAERGKLDLLAAPPGEIRRLLRAAGISGAGAIADHVVARRRAPEAGLGWRLGGRSVNDLEEVAAALRLDAAQFAQLRTVATIGNGLPTPDPLVAPDAVFRALDLTDDARRLLRREREKRTGPATRDALPAGFTLITLASTSTGVTARRVRMVQIEPDGRVVWGALLPY